MPWVFGLVGWLLLAGVLNNEITGVVSDGNRPVAGAVVRLQGTDASARTNERGEFTLDPAGKPVWPIAKVTAWATGYYIAGPFYLFGGQTDVRITLRRHHDTDDPGYAWVSAFSSAGQAGNCQNCHSNPATPQPVFPFDEWALDAHGTSAQNRRFFSMYNGTDLTAEHTSPLTRYAFHRDYGKIPLPPDPSQPYFGPGFKLDFPDSAGNCAACHAPAAAVHGPYDTDPNAVQGVGKEGVACDLCHKAWAVKLDPSTGLPYPNTPGVLSFEFRRPSAGHQLFLGPYDDVAPGDDSFSSLQNDSRICAPCHFARFWGVQVYNSFGEWLASPYSDPVSGRTCQDCHMPRRGAQFFARVEKGGLVRDPKTVFSHLMPGAADVPLLQDTAELKTTAEQVGSLVRVRATVTNIKAGHHIPTDHPARNILLVVTARDAAGTALPLVRGPVVPDWGGTGNEPTDYAGRPGRGYAKILEELWTEVAPTAAYWNPTVLREDTRIPAFGKDESQYEFRAPSAGTVTVEARLIFRRAFKTLLNQKNWDTPDILMGRAAAAVNVTAVAPFITVPATTFTPGSVAPESLVAGFGANLAASAPALAVLVTDAAGVERAATLMHVSAVQINYIVPGGTVPGPADVRVAHSGRTVAAGTLDVQPVAPGLFSANGDGRGVAAATAVRIGADGSRSPQAVYRCGAVCTAVPIDLGSPSDQVVLYVYGTGIRGRSGLGAVSARIGGIPAPVLSAGPQTGSLGLDEVSVSLPRSLAGAGEVPVLLMVDGRAANPVTIALR
jgi:uncharacterized protein (TIGR03437 family)